MPQQQSDGTPDLTGRSCMITGASSGIGRAAAHVLARAGASLVLVCRDRERGEAAVSAIRAASRNPAVELMLCDLSSQGQIRSLAADFLAKGRPLHVLLNNAGVINWSRSETEDGLETTFAVNHLAYFLLTALLLERLRESAPARIVNVASDAYRWAALDFDDLQTESGYRSMRVYGNSKLANLLFTRELARRLDGSGVTANAMHPGFVGSGFAGNNGVAVRAFLRLLRPFARTPEKGAETAVHLCTSPDVARVNGRYFFDGREHRRDGAAENDADARRLWEVSERLTGLAAS